jgi:hypothetical protein
MRYLLTPKPLYSSTEKATGPPGVQALLSADALPNTTAKSFADTICNFLNA